MSEKTGQQAATFNHIQRVRAEARREVAQDVLRLAYKAISDEPEFPSDMPDELWVQMNGNRAITERVLRNTVRVTKGEISARLAREYLAKYLGK